MNEIKPGLLINDRYCLESLLGKGGMGVVYKAHDDVLKRDVALKLLSTSGIGTDGRARLLREAQVVANLNHPNIVSVYDAGEIDETPYIVMEYVEGQTLNQAEVKNLDEIYQIGQQVCNALEHAHEQGIIHRDIKPENVIIEPNKNVKLMDFGLARSEATRLTSDGATVGTVFYMAPEQAMGDEIDFRTDLYSLGVLLYELVTGSLPFEAEDFIAVITQHLHAPVVPPRAKREDLPSHINKLITQLLNKKPEERPQSAAAVREILNASQSSIRDSSAEEFMGIDRIVRGRIIGREDEMKLVRNAWQATQANQGQVLLISGEPGIGKTRFTQEIITQVEFSGGRSLFGASYRESNAPYEPFAQIVRSLLRQSSDDVQNIPEPILADLIMIAPDLQAYFPDVKDNPKLEGAAEQQRIFENFYLFIELLAEITPILIVLDDVHWADSATLDLCRHLLRRTKTQQVLIVGTYREVELAGSVLFQNALNDFNREANSTRIKLGLLTKEQTHRLLTTIFDATISDDFLNGIYRETEGNPFFIEEVCKSLVDSGKLYFENGEWHRPDMGELEIPQSVMVAIQSRVNKMSEDVKQILLLAAIIGREFDYEVLAAASELNEDALIDIIEKAERAQLVEEVPRKGLTIFQFAHALIPATMVENVSSLRKRRMHRKVAEAMTEVKNADVSAMAYHFIEAGDLVNGLKYAREAGDRAANAIAYQEAITSYRFALECAEGLEITEEIIQLNRKIGEASDDIDFNQSIKHYQRAYDLEIDDVKRAGDLAMLAIQYSHIGETAIIPSLLEALPLLENAENHQVHYGWALAAISRYHHLRAEYETAIEYNQKSYDVMKTLDNPTALLRVMINFCGPYQHKGQFKESSKWAEETIRISKKEQVPITEAMGYEYLAENYSFTGRGQKAFEAAEKNYVIAEQYGFITRMAWAKFVMGIANNYIGQLETSLRHHEECIRLAQQVGDKRLESMARTSFGHLYVDLGERENAISQLEQALEIAKQLDEKQLFDYAYGFMAYLHWQFGEIDQGLEWAQKMYDSVIDSPQRRYAMYACVFLSGILVEKGTTDGIDELLKTDWDLIINEEVNDMEGLIYQIQGKAASLEGKHDIAAEYFEKALAIFKETNTMIDYGRVFMSRAKMWQLQGEIEKATEDARTARDIFEKHSAANDLIKAKVFLAEL